MVVSVTAVLLAWKANFSSIVYKSTKTPVIEKSIKKWLPLTILCENAENAAISLGIKKGELKLDKVDIKPEKGSVVFTYNSNFAVLINPQSGEIIQVEKRNYSWILQLHDGEIFDKLFHVTFFKKLYPTAVGLLLFIMTVTGGLLWVRIKFYPGRIKI